MISTGQSSATGNDDRKLLVDNATSKAGLSSFATINPVLATVAAAVQRSAIFSANNSNVQRNLNQANKISPSGQVKQRGGANDRSVQLPPNLFMSTIKNMGANTSRGQKSNSTRLNGNDGGPDAGMDATTVDTSSPYSPGSSLSDGMFDPPSPGTNHHSYHGSHHHHYHHHHHNRLGPNPSANIANNKGAKSGGGDKKDPFDALFGSSPINKSGNNKNRMKKTTTTAASAAATALDKRKKTGEFYCNSFFNLFIFNY